MSNATGDAAGMPQAAISVRSIGAAPAVSVLTVPLWSWPQDVGLRPIRAVVEVWW